MERSVDDDALGLSVETTDELKNAMAFAHARIIEVYASGRNTLIDQISADDFAAWDGLDEMAIVCDSESLDGEDLFDDDRFGLAA
jgi:hypothetical protein